MNIHTALEKIESLTKGELLHCIQRMDIEIENYKVCMRNYTEYKMKRFGLPYMIKLKKQKKQFLEKYESIC
jgi:hypothetical protein